MCAVEQFRQAKLTPIQECIMSRRESVVGSALCFTPQWLGTVSWFKTARPTVFIFSLDPALDLGKKMKNPPINIFKIL